MAQVLHPWTVVILLRRLAATAVVVALSVSHLAACTGWQPTAEARMACCQDESTCPMHKSDARRPGTKQLGAQAQADACCAGSEQSESATTRSALMSAGAVALVPAIVPLVVMSVVPALEARRALVPLLVSPVPKHLLLSVFLV